MTTRYPVCGVNLVRVDGQVFERWYLGDGHGLLNLAGDWFTYVQTPLQIQPYTGTLDFDGPYVIVEASHYPIS